MDKLQQPMLIGIWLRIVPARNALARPEESRPDSPRITLLAHMVLHSLSTLSETDQ